MYTQINESESFSFWMVSLEYTKIDPELLVKGQLTGHGWPTLMAEMSVQEIGA